MNRGWTHRHYHDGKTMCGLAPWELLVSYKWHLIDCPGCLYMGKLLATNKKAA